MVDFKYFSKIFLIHDGRLHDVNHFIHHQTVQTLKFDFRNYLVPYCPRDQPFSVLHSHAHYYSSNTHYFGVNPNFVPQFPTGFNCYPNVHKYESQLNANDFPADEFIHFHNDFTIEYVPMSIGRY